MLPPDDFQSLLAAEGAHFEPRLGHQVALAFVDQDTEYAAAHSGCVIVDSTARELVRLTGEDRLTFLQGMTSNDVSHLGPDGTCYTTFLTAKGAMVTDGWVIARSDEVFVDVEPGRGGPLVEHLSRFVVSEDVEVQEVSAQRAPLSLIGPEARRLLSEAVGLSTPPTSTKATAGTHEGAPFFATVSRLLPESGFDLYLPPGSLTSAWRALRHAGATPAGWLALEQLRLEAGVPRFGQDMDEATIPLEAGLQRAIHYEKGCYLGQEVIARATFRGQVAKLLVGLQLEAAPSALPTQLLREGKAVGRVTSATHSTRMGGVIGLGYVQRQCSNPGTEVRWQQEGRELRAVVQALPFRRDG